MNTMPETLFGLPVIWEEADGQISHGTSRRNRRRLEAKASRKAGELPSKGSATFKDIPIRVLENGAILWGVAAE